MGRQPDGNYVIPDGTYGQPDQTVYSARYNGWVNDVAATFNQPTPVNKGGTGASTAPDALTNLGAVAKAGDTMTGGLIIDETTGDSELRIDSTVGSTRSNIIGTKNGSDRWRFILGGVAAESGANVGTDFALQRFSDAGALIDNVFIVTRSTGETVFSGDLKLTKAAPFIRINKAASGQAQGIEGDTNGSVRWVLNLGDSAAETGANAGSNISLNRFTDAGAYIDTTLMINRASAKLDITGDLSINKAGPLIFLAQANVATGSSIRSTVGGNARWAVHLGSGHAETGGNAGTNFTIARYSDAGALIDSPIAIDRASGAITIKPRTTQIFQSGSGTYNSPAGCVRIRVRCMGGGGGGGGGGNPGAGVGGTGGNTTFGSLTANGGNGVAPGGASGGYFNISGAAGMYAHQAANGTGGAGGGGVFGGGGNGVAFGNVGGAGATNTGGGGGGGGSVASAFPGSGGGSGGYCEGNLAAGSYSYAVGAGGAAGGAGTGGVAGGAGGSGVVIVEEFYI